MFTLFIVKGARHHLYIRRILKYLLSSFFDKIILSCNRAYRFLSQALADSLQFWMRGKASFSLIVTYLNKLFIIYRNILCSDQWYYVCLYSGRNIYTLYQYTVYNRLYNNIDDVWKSLIVCPTLPLVLFGTRYVTSKPAWNGYKLW